MDSESRTYQNGATDEHQVPEEVLLAREARVTVLQLAHVRVDEIRVEEDAQLGTRDEEASYESPYLRRKTPEKRRVVDEVIRRDESHVDTNG